MAQFTVSPEELKNRAEELRNQNAQLKQQIEDLISYANALDSQWEGEAHDKFKSEFNRDSVQMTNFYNAIQEYCYRLEEISMKYQKAEIENANLIHSH